MKNSWSSYFLKIAEIVKSRSDCPRRQVGAVFVKDRRIVATGFNQAPSGVKHCSEAGCILIHGHCARSIHAELNGILNATKAGQTLEGSTAYVTSFPCFRCMSSMRNAGVIGIVYKDPYEYNDQEKQLLGELIKFFCIEEIDDMKHPADAKDMLSTFDFGKIGPSEF